MSDQFSHADILAFLEFQKAKKALQVNSTPTTPAPSTITNRMSSTPKSTLSAVLPNTPVAKTSTRGRRSKENVPENQSSQPSKQSNASKQKSAASNPRTSASCVDLEAEPTHALVLWQEDNKMTIVPVGHVINKTKRPLCEESDYLTKWSNKQLLAKIISLGSHADCKRIQDIKPL